MVQRRAEPDSKKKTFGIWLRVSTDDQIKGESPEAHEKARAHLADFARMARTRGVQIGCCERKSLAATEGIALS